MGGRVSRQKIDASRPLRRTAALGTSLVLGGLGSLGVAGIAAAPAAHAVAAVGPPTTVTIANAGAPQPWTAPQGVTQATFDLFGAPGQGAPSHQGGAGGETIATMNVVPGQTYWIVTGGALGGGGASTSAPGGGATDLRTAPTDVNTRLLVAGGGGGAGGDVLDRQGINSSLDLAGGAAGIGGSNPTAGGDGSGAGNPIQLTGGGGGGAPTGGAPGTFGAGGVPVSPAVSTATPGSPGLPGAGGLGGAGGAAGDPGTLSFRGGGGGGGGGCLGGGGGGGGAYFAVSPTVTSPSAGGGGGGGSSCVLTPTIGAPSYNDGVNFLPGFATITFQAPLPQAQVSPQSLAFGSQIVNTTSPAQTVTVTNPSAVDLHVSGVGITGADAGDYGATPSGCSTVAPGASCSIAVTFTPSASGPRNGTLNVTDDATGSPQQVSLSGTGVTPVPTADLSVTKTGPSTATAGSDLAYTVNVINGGPNDAQDVSVSDAVPAGTTFVSLSAPAGWTSTTPALGGTGTITTTIPTLAPGAPSTFSLVMHVASAGSVSNTAVVSSTTADPYLANNVSTANTSVDKAPTTTHVSSSMNPVTAGQPVTFTAIVAPESGTGTPAGTVQFKDNGTNLGSPQTLDATGRAALVTSSLSAADHTIEADYGGSGIYAMSSGSTNETVNAADAPLTIVLIGGVADKHGNAAAGATFTDADPKGNLSQYSASIDWGDQSPPGPAPIIRNPFGGFAAGWIHHYRAPGTYRATITIRDNGGATVSRTTTVFVPRER